MGNLFKSRREREKEARRERRRAFRQAENAVDDVKDRIREMERDARKQWERAREELKAGRRAAAQRLITGYRAAQVLMTKLEQKRWVFEQYLAKMRSAQTDGEFAAALEAVNRVAGVDPEHVADVFDAAGDILGDQMDVDRFWGRLHEKEMDGAAGALEDRIPSIEELSQQLEAEAAAEIGDSSGKEQADGDLEERIGRGHDRVRKLLDEKQ